MTPHVGLFLHWIVLSFLFVNDVLSYEPSTVDRAVAVANVVMITFLVFFTCSPSARF